MQVMKGVPVQRYSRQESAIAYWILGAFLGKACSNNKKGTVCSRCRCVLWGDQWRAVSLCVVKRWEIDEKSYCSLRYRSPAGTYQGEAHVLQMLGLASSCHCNLHRCCRQNMLTAKISLTRQP